MHIREGGNELRNGVVGYDIGQQLRLVYPAKGRLVARQLHPNRVFAACRNNADVGHNHMVVTFNVKRVELNVGNKLFGLLPNEGQRIGLYHEVIIVRVVVRGRKRKRI